MGCGAQQVKLGVEDEKTEIRQEIEVQESKNKVQEELKPEKCEKKVSDPERPQNKSGAFDVAKFTFPLIQNFESGGEQIPVRDLNADILQQLDALFAEYGEIIDFNAFQEILERFDVNLKLETQEQVFHFLDDDGDSKLTLKELIHAFFIAFNVQSRPDDSAFIYFLYLDQDRCGSISLQQLQWCFKDLNIKKSQREIQKLFDTLKNDDNKISCLNFVKNFGAISV